MQSLYSLDFSSIAEYQSGIVFFEYDNYQNRWKIWDFYTYMSKSYYYYNLQGQLVLGSSTYRFRGTDVLQTVPVYAHPQWELEGQTKQIYQGQPISFYMRSDNEVQYPPGQAGVSFDLSIVKTCSPDPIFTSVSPGSETHSFKDFFPTCSIQGHPRLSEFGKYLTAFSQAYPAQATVVVTGFDQPQNGTLNVRVYNDNNQNFVWQDSNGTDVTENPNVKIDWSIAPVNSTTYSMNLTGTLGNGPANSPGIVYQKFGNLTIPGSNQTTTGNVTVTFTPQPGISANGTGRIQSRNEVVPNPPHKVVKVTLIEDTVLGPAPAGYYCPVAFDNARGTEFYIYRNSQTQSLVSSPVFGAMYWPVPPAYQRPTGNPLLDATHTNKLFGVTGTASVVPAPGGIIYRFTLTCSYNHAPDLYPESRTTYRFTSDQSAVIPYVTGANATVNLTASYSGNVTQTINLGRARLEVIEP